MNSFLHTPSSPSSARIQSIHYQGGSSFSASQFQYHQQQQQQQQSPSSAFFGSSFGNSFTKPSTGITIPFGRRPSGNYGRFASTSSMAIGAGGPPGRYRTRQQSDSDSSSIDGLGRYHNSGTMSTSHSQSQLFHRSQHHRQNSIAESSFGEGIGRFFPKKHAQGSSIDSMDSMGHATALVGEMPAPINSDNSLHLTFSELNRRAAGAGGPDSAGSSTSFHPLTPSNSSFPAFGSMPSFMGLMQETLEEQEERESNIKEKIRRSCPRSVIDDKLMLAGLAPYVFVVLMGMLDYELRIQFLHLHIFAVCFVYHAGSTKRNGRWHWSRSSFIQTSSPVSRGMNTSIILAVDLLLVYCYCRKAAVCIVDSPLTNNNLLAPHT